MMHIVGRKKLKLTSCACIDCDAYYLILSSIVGYYKIVAKLNLQIVIFFVSNFCILAEFC